MVRISLKIASIFLILIVLYVVILETLSRIGDYGREKIDISHNRMNAIAKRLDSMKPQDWPNTLDVFARDCNIIDPFTGVTFYYKVKVTVGSTENADWILIGSGPDKIINYSDSGDHYLEYDPTNGQLSSGGDIVYTSSIAPTNYLVFLGHDRPFRRIPKIGDPPPKTSQ